MDDYAFVIQAGDRQNLLLIGLKETFEITLASGVVIHDLIHLCQSAQVSRPRGEEIFDSPGRLFGMDALLFIELRDGGVLGPRVKDVKE